MEAALLIVDQTPTGKVLGTTKLRLVSEQISVRDLIEARVREEVRAFNQEAGSTLFRGLVQPTDTESDLNGYRMRKSHSVDAEGQVQEALQAFGRNGFLLLVNDQQVTSLDEHIVFTPRTRVSFVKLVPLVGG